jgi:hypothetical protein
MREFFQAVERNLFGSNGASSIPLKSCTFKAKPLNPLHSPAKSITSRQATAIVIMAKAAGVTLEPGAVVPRSHQIAGENWVIENGCAQDIVRAGVAEWIPNANSRQDNFVLSRPFINWLHANVSVGSLSEFQSAALPASLSAS